MDTFRHEVLLEGLYFLATALACTCVLLTFAVASSYCRPETRREIWYWRDMEDGWSLAERGCDGEAAFAACSFRREVRGEV